MVKVESRVLCTYYIFWDGDDKNDNKRWYEEEESEDEK